MRFSLVAIVGICTAATASELPEEAKLCEILVQDQHSPYLAWYTQEIANQSVSKYSCKLYSTDARENAELLFQYLESRCRAFVTEAMQASTECHGTEFSPTFGELIFQRGVGEDLDGPFIVLTATATRYAP